MSVKPKTHQELQVLMAREAAQMPIGNLTPPCGSIEQGYHRDSPLGIHKTLQSLTQCWQGVEAISEVLRSSVIPSLKF